MLWVHKWLVQVGAHLVAGARLHLRGLESTGLHDYTFTQQVGLMPNQNLQR